MGARNKFAFSMEMLFGSPTMRTRRLLCHRPVAQWIRCLTTDQKIPGSNPGGVVFFSVIVLNLEVIGSLQDLEFLDLQRAMALGGLMA